MCLFSAKLTFMLKEFNSKMFPCLYHQFLLQYYTEETSYDSNKQIYTPEEKQEESSLEPPAVLFDSIIGLYGFKYFFNGKSQKHSDICTKESSRKFNFISGISSNQTSGTSLLF